AVLAWVSGVAPLMVASRPCLRPSEGTEPTDSLMRLQLLWSPWPDPFDRVLRIVAAQQNGQKVGVERAQMPPHRPLRGGTVPVRDGLYDLLMIPVSAVALLRRTRL